MQASVKATASANPDTWGKTGYGNSTNVGLTVNSDTFFIKGGRVSTDVYPNYTIRASIHESYMGSFTGNITPVLRDSGGVLAQTSGSIPVSLSRSFCWGNSTRPMPTLINRKVTLPTEVVGIFVDDLDWFHAVNIDSDAITTYIYANREWNTLMALSQNAGLYNEVKFEHVSGDTGWAVTASYDLTTQRAKNTFYDVRFSMAKSAPIGNATTVSSVIRATFRNKTNNTITFSQDFTLQVSR